MDDFENDLKKFEEDDRLRPIDTGGPPSKLPSQEPAVSQESSSPQQAPVPQEPRKSRKEMAFSPVEARINNDEPNYIKRGQYVDLLEIVPTLRRITIGGGWEHDSFANDPVDVDLSLFLLDKNDQTRIDEDFVFYNNPRACDGAIQHRSDSRTGAGLGDDESFFLDLNGLPYDILKIVCVFSIYDPEIKGDHFGMIRDLYLRIVNKDDGDEIFRYKLDEKDCQGGTAVIAGTLIREGPKWIFEASAKTTNGGLAKFAVDYGIIVKELQSTYGLDELQAQESAPGKKE